MEWSPWLLQGTIYTLGLVLLSLALGLAFGLPMALGQVYGSRPARYCIGAYVWFFRGLPVLVLLFLFYFGIFPSLNLDIPVFFIGVVVLGLRGAAYQAEIFRGAIQSIPDGQMLAARSLGMSQWQAIGSVILPQALLIALPGWSNEYPEVLTETSVCYAIGVLELLTRASQIVAETYIAMPIYVSVAILYILLNYAGMQALHGLERRVMVPGFAQVTS